MSCEYCRFRHGCTIKHKYEDGTAVFPCDIGIDFGRDKPKTVILEQKRNGEFNIRYDLPYDPYTAAIPDIFDDDDFMSKTLKLFADCAKTVEREIYRLIDNNPICYRNPCEAILNGICGVSVSIYSVYPRGYEREDRYEISQFFIQFPIGIPTELKGIAV